MKNNAGQKPEILSPAGSLEAFFAAMESGADAVYCGLKEFSARAKAKNFSLGDLEQMLGYARGRGRKIYVTLNTLVKERELPQLAETLSALEALQVDGVILQDLAVWRMAREHFPGLELHASTQMTIHNAAGVKMLEKMGFTRAVLARELSLAEIAAIRAQTTVELEHFIHGALCFSFSGQCYFSSYLGGKSGNRGRCAQPCRRRYRYRQQDGYYFSPNDLSAIDLLPDLTKAGVISFKIEGRMKSAEYVANVVSAYRMALDAPSSGRSDAIREAKNLLKASFGRPPTQGFLPGGAPKDIAIPSVKGSTGRFLGEVSAVRGSEIAFKTRDRLHIGDRLRIQPKTDKAGTAFTVKTLKLGKQTVKKVSAGSFVNVPSPFSNQFKVGDGVFKVSSEQAFTMSDAACRRKLGAAPKAAAPLKLDIQVGESELTLRGQAGASTLECRYPITSYPATEKGLSLEVLRAAFAQTAQEPLVLEELTAGELPAVVIPPKRLKEIRRDFYRTLVQEHRSESKKAQRQKLATALKALLPAGAPRQDDQRQISVAIRDLRDVHIINDPAVDRVLVPLTPANMQGLGRAGKRLSGRYDQVIWDLPLILLDSQWRDYRQAVTTLVERGFKNFRLNNLGHFDLFDGLEGVELQTSYRLFSLNSQAALAWAQLGARETMLYIEDDRENLAELLQRDAGVSWGITAYASVPLITSRISIRGLRPDTPVRSDRGEGYRVSDRGLTVLNSETDFSLLGHLRELEGLGCNRFTLDLSHLGPFSPEGKQVLDAFKKGHPVPGTSVFNYQMGME